MKKDEYRAQEMCDGNAYFPIFLLLRLHQEREKKYIQKNTFYARTNTSVSRTSLAPYCQFEKVS